MTEPPAGSVDPRHVDRVVRRYLAYANHGQAQGRRVMPLAEWFRWYALENADLINADAAAAPASCSVSTQAAGAPRADRSRDLYAAVAEELARQARGPVG
jgi:hypothetical protein